MYSVHGQGLNLPTDYIRNSAQGNNIKWEKVEGSPYHYDEFKDGRLQINDSVYDARMRYNIYRDEIELKEEGNRIINLLKRGYIKIAIGNENLGIHRYISGDKLKQGYFLELTNNSVDSSILLLKKLKTTLVEASEATSTYKKDTPPRLVREYDYYLKLSEKPARLIRLNKRSILSVLKEDNKVRQYFSKNKVKNEIEIINFIEFYNSN